MRPTDPLPEPTKKPCNECPWRREAEPGFLGPHTAEEWAGIIHMGHPVACHKTINTDGDWTQPHLRQCAGAATFRANARTRPPWNPNTAIGPADPERVFTSPREFLTHHRPAGSTPAPQAATAATGSRSPC